MILQKKAANLWTYYAIDDNFLRTIIEKPFETNKNSPILAERILKTYLVDAGSGAVLECLEWIASELNKKDVDVGTAPLTQLYDILKTVGDFL